MKIAITGGTASVVRNIARALAKKIPFARTQIRRRLPSPCLFGLRDISSCRKRQETASRRNRVFFELP